MNTTDTTALQERIGRILNDEGWTFEGIHEPGDYDECEDCRLTVDPIAARIAQGIAAEVRKAQADAWDEGYAWGCFDDTDGFTRNPYREESYE